MVKGIEKFREAQHILVHILLANCNSYLRQIGVIHL